jgi:hypothetical protein
MPASLPEEKIATIAKRPGRGRPGRTGSLAAIAAGAPRLAETDVSGLVGKHGAASLPALGPALRSDSGRAFRPVSPDIAITPTVSVVIPAMNEAANLPAVFATVPEWVDEIVLVDGRSTDDTVVVARTLRPDVKVVLQGGIGKGDALLAGFAEATGDIIVTLDADGSADGGEIVSFVSTLLGGADFAKGSRFASAGGSEDITLVRRYGNKLLSVAVNAIFGTQYTDLCYGFNAFWSRHLAVLNLDSAGFEVETQMSIKAAKAGLRVHEVPSHERPRIHGSSNLIAARDGCRVMALILQERFSARRRRRPRPFLAPGRRAADELAPEAGNGGPSW